MSEVFHAPDRPPQPFEAGELVFYDTHVELCGVKLSGDVHCGVIRRILDLLAQKRPDGRRMFFSGEQLARRLELECRQAAVAEAVRDFRNLAERLLREEAEIQIDRKRDLILNDRRHGYRLSAKLTAVQVGETVSPDAAAEPVEPEHGPEHRRQWILEQLRRGRRLQRKHVVAELDCSPSTADRDLKCLRDAGEIEFVGAARTG